MLPDEPPLKPTCPDCKPLEDLQMQQAPYGMDLEKTADRLTSFAIGPGDLVAAVFECEVVMMRRTLHVLWRNAVR